MLNIQSTNAHVDVSDEYAELVMSAVDASGAIPERLTERGEYYVRVLTVDVPLCPPHAAYIVDYSDPASREVEEYSTLEDAEERYEEYVRASAGDLADDEVFEITDVPGVPGYDGDDTEPVTFVVTIQPGDNEIWSDTVKAALVQGFSVIGAPSTMAEHIEVTAGDSTDDIRFAPSAVLPTIWVEPTPEEIATLKTWILGEGLTRFGKSSAARISGVNYMIQAQNADEMMARAAEELPDGEL